MKSLGRTYLVAIILSSILFLIPTVYSKLEVCGYIDKIVDGDTVWISVENVLEDRYGNFSRESLKVRLADINAPELSTPEGLRSRDALLQLINEYGSFACLDIDDIKIYDRYGRLVAILYLNYNETHLLNVNMYLVENGYAEYVDYDNEFDASHLTLYVAKDVEVSGDTLPEIYILLLLFLVIAIFIIRRRKIQL